MSMIAIDFITVLLFLSKDTCVAGTAFSWDGFLILVGPHLLRVLEEDDSVPVLWTKRLKYTPEVASPRRALSLALGALHAFLIPVSVTRKL